MKKLFFCTILLCSSTIVFPGDNEKKKESNEQNTSNTGSSLDQFRSLIGNERTEQARQLEERINEKIQGGNATFTRWENALNRRAAALDEKEKILNQHADLLIKEHNKKLKEQDNERHLKMEIDQLNEKIVTLYSHLVVLAKDSLTSPDFLAKRSQGLSEAEQLKMLKKHIEDSADYEFEFLVQEIATSLFPLHKDDQKLYNLSKEYASKKLPSLNERYKVKAIDWETQLAVPYSTDAEFTKTQAVLRNVQFAYKGILMPPLPKKLAGKIQRKHKKHHAKFDMHFDPEKLQNDNLQMSKSEGTL